MKRVIGFLLVLAMASVVNAVPVSSTTAKAAAVAWAKQGMAMGVRLNASASSVATYAVTNSYAFYAVKLKNSGVVFLSSDTELEPIIGFSANSSVDLQSGSPLRALLDGDIAYRAARLEASAASSSSALSGTASKASNTSSVSAAAAAWAWLLNGSGSQSSKFAASEPQTSVDDVRVEPLVETKWSQEGVSLFTPCYNYYTPYNWPCGCSATALAQLIRYYRFPTAEQPEMTRKCSYCPVGTIDSVATNLTTLSGTYAWDLMVAEPDDTTPEKSLQAIGMLTYNAGVLLQSEYTSGRTGAFVEDAAKVLRSDLGYANAVAFENYKYYKKKTGGLHLLSIREKTIYANLDAHLPVELGIYGYERGHEGDDGYFGGHAVVADGYGYKQIGDESVAFVHLNLGWEGNDDLWYNIPSIHTGTGVVPGGPAYDFDYLYSAVFNVMTETTGEILSGRVLDVDGNPVVQATVRAVDLNSGTVAGEMKTDAHGIYAFVLPGDVTYRLTATSADGKVVVVRDGDVKLGTTAVNSDYVVGEEEKIGNRWGKDIILENPAVRIGTVEFVTLDSALEAAKAAVATTPSLKPELEIFAPTRLRKSFTVDFPCVVRAMSGRDPAEQVVTRAEQAVLDVAANGELTLRDVAFAGGETNLVAVAEGGVLKLGSGVDFGLKSGAVAVRTATATGFEMLDVLTSGFALYCSVATNANEVFGSYSCPAAAAEKCASMIANPVDEEIRGVADTENGKLVWKAVMAPVSESAGYYVDAAGLTNSYSRLDRVFENFAAAMAAGKLPAAPELVIRKDAKLTRSLTIDAQVTVRGLNAARVTDLGPQAGFVINGGTLKVESLAFDGFTGNALFLVNGGNLELKKCELHNLNGTNYHSGAVAALKGSVKVTDVVFDNCRATGRYAMSHTVSARGGAIYLGGTGCSLELLDTVITNCFALNHGGGIYVCKGSAFALGGGATRIMNNQAGLTTVNREDVYCPSTEVTLRVSALMNSDDPVIGVRYGAAAGNQADYAFASIDAGVLSGEAAVRQVQYESICKCFFNDYDDELSVGDPDVDACQRLAWRAKPEEDHTDPTGAACQLSGRGDRYDGYYRRVAEAFRLAQDGVTIRMLVDGTFASDIVVSNRVSLVSDNASPFRLSRDGEYSIKVTAGGELTVSNVCVAGVAAGASAERSVPLLAVDGGRLILAQGARVCDALGIDRRDANGVMVWNGGEFTMLSGSVIEKCYNHYAVRPGEKASGGGLLVDDGVVYLRGGEIRDCYATNGVGAMISSYSRVKVSGDVKIGSNASWTYAATNLLTVSDTSRLDLEGPFTGLVRVQEGLLASTVEFGRVTWATADLAAVEQSARRFLHGATSVCGTVVTNQTEWLLVWRSALSEDGYYTAASGIRYYVADGSTPSDPPVVDPPDDPDQPEEETQAPSLQLTRDSSGNLRVVCQPFSAEYTYTLWATDSLLEPFKPISDLEPTAEGVFEINDGNSGACRFYKVVAEPK